MDKKLTQTPDHSCSFFCNSLYLSRVKRRETYSNFLPFSFFFSYPGERTQNPNICYLLLLQGSGKDGKTLKSHTLAVIKGILKEQSEDFSEWHSGGENDLQIVFVVARTRTELTFSSI